MRAAISTPRSPTSNDPLEAEAGPDLVDLPGHGHRAAGRAFEDLDGDRATAGRAQQAEDDLQDALLAAAAVAAPGEHAGYNKVSAPSGDLKDHRPREKERRASEEPRLKATGPSHGSAPLGILGLADLQEAAGVVDAALLQIGEVQQQVTCAALPGRSDVAAHAVGGPSS